MCDSQASADVWGLSVILLWHQKKSSVIILLEFLNHLGEEGVGVEGPANFIPGTQVSAYFEIL